MRRLRTVPANPTPRKRLRVRSIQVLPTCITATNLMAGLLALSYLMDAASASSETVRDGFIVRAAWLLFLGMLCDALDGRIARMTGTTSAFGAQLDSLADVVTFGVAPALISRVALGFYFPAMPGKLLVALAIVYILGAALRLARYNVETARVEESEGSGHVTNVFRGLPSPAAAGMIASLVILRHHYGLHWLDWALIVLTPVLGLCMVSRLPYSHLLNRYFDGKRPLVAVVFLMCTVYMVVQYFEETVCAGFFLYVMSGPAAVAWNRITGGATWASDEAGDEAPAPEPELRSDEELQAQ